MFDDEQPTYTTLAEFLAAGGSAMDNCGLDDTTFHLLSEFSTPGDCPKKHLNTRTYSIADLCGNTTTCVQLITVDDITPPTITCPGDLSFECIGDVPAANIALVASDNCGVPVVTWEGDVWAGTCPRIITRTYMAEDSCGNTTTCVQRSPWTISPRPRSRVRGI